MLQCIFLYVAAISALFVPLYAMLSIPILILQKAGICMHMAKYFIPSICAFIVSNSICIKKILKAYLEIRKEKKCTLRRKQITYSVSTNCIKYQVF